MATKKKNVTKEYFETLERGDYFIRVAGTKVECVKVTSVKLSDKLLEITGRGVDSKEKINVSISSFILKGGGTVSSGTENETYYANSDAFIFLRDGIRIGYNAALNRLTKGLTEEGPFSMEERF